MTERPIAYEPHPVTAERKAELRAKGFRIVDARFAPAGAVPAEPLPEVQPEPKAADVSEEKALTRTDIARMSRANLFLQLEARGLETDGSAETMRERLASEVFGE